MSLDSSMDFSRYPDLLEGVVDQLIDEEALGVCLEMHRAIKLGYYELLYPDDSVYEKHEVVEVKGLDIFGNSPQHFKKSVDCVCPNCNRTLGAQKFAPHLEKCMGMGRNSSRLRKQKTPVDSDQEASDDNEDEWTYPERRGIKKIKKEKEKMVTNSPRRPNSGRPGRPPKNHDSLPAPESFYNLKPSLQQHNQTTFTGLPLEHRQALLLQMCAVVSERTGRLCTRSVNCPQHTEEQRQDVRRQLLYDQEPMDIVPSPSKRPRERGPADLSDEDIPSVRAPMITAAARKKLKKHRRTKGGGGGGHGSASGRSLMHTSSGSIIF